MIQEPAGLNADGGGVLTDITRVEYTARELLKLLVLDGLEEPMADLGRLGDLLEADPAALAHARQL
jgi:hypothetical protein